MYQCDACNGKGTIQRNKHFPNIVATCSKCNGAGTLNWIENIFGKPSIHIKKLYTRHIIKSDKWIIQYPTNKWLVSDIATFDENGDSIIPDMIRMRNNCIEIEFSDKITGCSVLNYI